MVTSVNVPLLFIIDSDFSGANLLSHLQLIQEKPSSSFQQVRQSV